MVPIGSDAVLEYKDEKSGITYKTRPAVGRHELMIRAALRLLVKPGESGAGNDGELYDAVCAVVDALLIGWSHDKLKLPEFKENPSAMFKLDDLYTLFAKIIDINKVGGEEAKN